VTRNTDDIDIKTIKDLEKRLAKKIERRGPDDCWWWKGRRRKCAQAPTMRAFYSDGTPGAIPIPRLIYRMLHGDLPPLTAVAHKCGNSWCCNPDHLIPGGRQWWRE